MFDVHLLVHGCHPRESYLADISLISAVLFSPSHNTEDGLGLPELFVVPELHALLLSVVEPLSESAKEFVNDVLIAGYGRQIADEGRLYANTAAAAWLLRMVRVEGPPDDLAVLGTLGGEVPTAVVRRIRRATADLAMRNGMPVVAIGSGFKRFLSGMPALIFNRSVHGLESIRWGIRRVIGGDRRCIWFVMFAELFGECVESHLGIDGIPARDIAIMVDP